jgi:hypothetical protein
MNKCASCVVAVESPPIGPDPRSSGSALHSGAGGYQDTSTDMVRIVVKLRLAQYDELSRHVREVGSTMSAFCRESVTRAIEERRIDKESTSRRR